MHNSLILLEKIILEPPVRQIYSRLGFKKKTTSLSAPQKKETDLLIRNAQALIALQGVFCSVPILQNDGETVDFADGLLFRSRKLAAFLGDCREAVLLGATAGSAIMDAIREKSAADQMTAAVVYDATASEMADAALDWITDYLNRQLLRERKQLLSRRFSAGYADFSLENQKAIYEKLQMEKIGVTITERCLLLPEKTVTAVCGIRNQAS